MLLSLIFPVLAGHRLGRVNTSKDQKRNGIQLILWKQLDDFDFADDLALPSHTQQIHDNTNMLAENSARLGLTINRGKINDTHIKVQGEALEEVDSFTYLGSILEMEERLQKF
ncbi:hypothetical protein DPMN_098062 [Dreissena polymorpha]|uniref:Reverse transcriptase domain-containing protein n=1 Tax=Dreissena polymorpha TaxID=45954 RepID=A0A9D4R5A4_DREPO|nr:hypothetical protein DPMN_098062 [Dreissena polymorpha]